MIHYSTFNIQSLHRLFFYLLILFLPTQLGFHTWPDWAMVLGRRVDYLSPTLFFTDVLIALMLLFWCIEFISRMLNAEYGIMKKICVSSSFSIQYSVFPLLIFIAVVNTYFAESRTVAIYHWIKFVEFALLGYYIIKTKPLRSTPIGSGSTIYDLLSVGVLYASLIAIGQFAVQHSIGGPLWLLGERTFDVNTPGIARVVIDGKEWLRAYGTFSHPNVLGGYIAAVLPLIVYQLTNLPINKFIRSKKMFYSSVIVAGIIALVLTFSRSAWMVAALGIGITYYVLWKRTGKNAKPLIRHTITVILLLIVIFSIAIFFPSPNDESVVVRGQLNQAAVSVWKSAPLFGVGLGNFLVALPQFLPSRTIYFLQPVHNIYLLLLSEVGIVGIGLLGFIIYLALNTEYRIRNVVKKYTPVNFMIQYSLFSILLLGLVDHYPLTLQQGRLLFTLLLALSWRL